MLLQALCIISSPYVNSNWSYGPETAKWGHDLCDLDLWPWPFAWTSLLSLVITPENFMMIRWLEHCQKGVTDRRTDRQTDRQTDRNPLNWRVRWPAWPRPVGVPLFSLRLKAPLSPCGHSGRLSEAVNPLSPTWGYRKIYIDYRSKFSYWFILSISIIYGNTNTDIYRYKQFDNRYGFWISISIGNTSYNSTLLYFALICISIVFQTQVLCCIFCFLESWLTTDKYHKICCLLYNNPFLLKYSDWS